MISPFPATTKCPKITDDLQGVGEWEPFPEPNEGPYGPQLTPKQVATSDNEHYQNMINVLSQFADDSKVSYSLFDLQGKRIVTGEYTAGKGEEMVSLPTNDLADGIYIFNAESNSAFYNKKIIVAR